MKRLLHGTLRLRNSPTGEQIQNGRPKDEIPRDNNSLMWPTTVLSLFFPCRNFCAENFVIFFYEIKLSSTYLLTAGTKGGGAGVIVTCGDPADPTILHWSHLRGAAFTSSFAKEAAAMQLALEWATANHPESSLTINRAVNRYSRQKNAGLQ